MDYDNNGNQLLNIKDLAVHNLAGTNSLKEYIPKGDGSFEYDANGNLTKDSDREIDSI